MLVLVREARLDLLVLGEDPRVGLVPVCVELREDLEALFRLVVVNEPARGLWLVLVLDYAGLWGERTGEEENDGPEEAGWDELDGCSRQRETRDLWCSQIDTYLD